jgi:hypothetical protein
MRARWRHDDTHRHIETYTDIHTPRLVSTPRTCFILAPQMVERCLASSGAHPKLLLVYGCRSLDQCLLLATLRGIVGRAPVGALSVHVAVSGPEVEGGAHDAGATPSGGENVLLFEPHHPRPPAHPSLHTHAHTCPCTHTCIHILGRDGNARLVCLACIAANIT